MQLQFGLGWSDGERSSVPENPCASVVRNFSAVRSQVLDKKKKHTHSNDRKPLGTEAQRFSS